MGGIWEWSGWGWAGWGAVSGLGTVVALLTLVTQEGVRMRANRRDQATKIFLHPKQSSLNGVWVADIINASAKPIHHVVFVSRPTLPDPPLRAYVHTIRSDLIMIIMPGETKTVDVIVRPGHGPPPHLEGRVYVEFRDMEGRPWRVDQFGSLHRGRLHERRRRAYRHVVRWMLLQHPSVSARIGRLQYRFRWLLRER